MVITAALTGFKAVRGALVAPPFALSPTRAPSLA